MGIFLSLLPEKNIAYTLNLFLPTQNHIHHFPPWTDVATDERCLRLDFFL